MVIDTGDPVNGEETIEEEIVSRMYTRERFREEDFSICSNEKLMKFDEDDKFNIQ